MTSDARTVTVANGEGTRYRATLTADDAPSSLKYDPDAGPQETTSLDLAVQNTSSFDWDAGATEARYAWIAADGTVLANGANAASIDAVGAGDSTTVDLDVAPPTLPEGTSRGEYTLRVDLFDVASGEGFASHGNQPFETRVDVQKTLTIGLGLERYYEYDGAELGGGMQHLVNLASGDSLVRFMPFDDPGRGLSTVVDLTYNSLEGRTSSPAGNGFSLSVSSLTRFGSPLRIGDETIELDDGDGTTHVFTSSDGSSWLEPNGVHLYLRRYSTSDDSRAWALTRPDGSTFFYDVDGNPTSVEDRNGNAITFTLDDEKRASTVTDAGGRAVTLAYFGADDHVPDAVLGRLKRIVDHAHEELDFAYYDDGNLLRITQRGGTHGDGSYLADRSYVFTYTTADGTAPAIADAGGRSAPDPATVESTQLYSVRDPLGHETTFAYLANGKLASRVDRSGAETDYTYDTGTRTTTVARPESRTSSYAFDVEGKVTTITNPLDQQILVDWTSDRQVHTITEPGGGVLRFAYDDNGDLTDSWDELDDHTELEYTSHQVDGDDTSSHWAAARTIPHISELTKKTDPDGTATPTAGDYEWQLSYDGDGNLTSTTDPLGNSTHATYADDGTLRTSTDADGNTTSFDAYDANGEPGSVTDALGNVTTFGYDPDGNLVWSQDANHQDATGGDSQSYRTTYHYDSFGRLDLESTPKSTTQAPGLLVWSQVSYDANDNVVASMAPYYGTDPTGMGAVTSTAYDAMDRPTLVTGANKNADPAGERMAYAYDAAGRLTQTTSPKGMRTPDIPDDFSQKYVYDALDRVVREEEPDYENGALARVARTHYCYSAAGDLVGVTSAGANLATVDCSATTPAYTTTSTYDAAHRLLTQADPLGYEQRAEYDASGRAVKQWNQDDDYSTYTYDERGQLRETTVPFGGQTSRLTTQYEYDANGNLSRLISPRALTAHQGSGPVTDYVEAYHYDKLNQLVRTDLPTGPGETPTYIHRSYDALGRLEWVSLPVVTADPAGVDAQHATVMDYWDTGWLRTSKDPATPRVHFDYTAQGWQSEREPEDQTGEIDRSREMLWTYDADGHAIEQKDLGGQGSVYSFDANGNLTGATETGGLTASGQAPLNVHATWDGLGNLISTAQTKAGSTDTLATTYGYDLDGDLIDQVSNEELDSAGAVVSVGRHQTFAYDQRGLPTEQVDDGSDSGTSDDTRIVSAYTPTGLEATRTTSHLDGATWAPEQVVSNTYLDNGSLGGATTRNGSGDLLESHEYSYWDHNGVFQDGNRTSDTYQLVGPDTSAPCRATTCTSAWTFDGQGRLTSEDDGHGDQTNYTLDPAGNIVAQTATTGTGTTHSTFTYVGQQLRTESDEGVIAKRYFYDGDGDLRCVTNGLGAEGDCAAPTGGGVADELLQSYAYDYRGRLASSHTYDAGTLTSSSETTYDPLDRPVSEADTSSGSSPTQTLLQYVGLTDQVASEDDSVSGSQVGTKSYSYDAFGTRIGLTLTPTAGTAQHYTFGYDPHGSVSMLVSSSGTAVASYGYTAYGKTDAALTDGPGTGAQPLNPYRYTGKRLDAGSATLDMGARRYSPADGRFLQHDVLFGAVDNLSLSNDPLTGNRYALAGGNPLGFVEIDGHRPMVDDPNSYALWSLDGGKTMMVTFGGRNGTGATTSNPIITEVARELSDKAAFGDETTRQQAADTSTNALYLGVWDFLDEYDLSAESLSMEFKKEMVFSVLEKVMDASAGSLAEAGKINATGLSKALRESEDPAVRSNAAGRLRAAGKLAKNLEKLDHVVGRASPFVIGGIGVGIDIAHGEDPGKAIASGIGSTIGGLVGGEGVLMACGMAGVATGGTGAVACVGAAIVGSAIVGVIGSVGGGKLYGAMAHFFG
jgi:RHS repeat-associated protein